MTDAASGQRRWLYWVPVLVVMVLIFVLSSQSGLRVSEEAAVDKPFRVSGHLLAFASLAGLLLVALSRGRRPTLGAAGLAFVITIIYGATDELHQSLVPDRAGRLDDLLVDAVGALVGVAVAWVVLTLRVRSREGDAHGAADHAVGE